MSTLLTLFFIPGISFETNDQKRQFIIWESQIAEECVEEEKAARFNKEYKLNKNLQK